MSNAKRTDRDVNNSDVMIVEEWDTAAHMKYEYNQKANRYTRYAFLMLVLTAFWLIVRGLLLWSMPDATDLLVVSRAFMFMGSVGLFGSAGGILYYQWRAQAIDSTITYKLEHASGKQEDITAREVAAISLGYERDHFDDVPESEVPCPRCLEVHE